MSDSTIEWCDTLEVGDLVLFNRSYSPTDYKYGNLISKVGIILSSSNIGFYKVSFPVGNVTKNYILHRSFLIKL